MGKLRMLLQIAARNLFGSVINLLIGAAIFAGTFAVVVGGALLDSLDEAMSKSIIGSVAGHIQVYSSESKDKFELWPSFGEDQNLEPISDFSKLKASLEKVPNVEKVVPMGMAGAFITSGNTIDVALAKLRKWENERKEQGPSPALDRQIAAQKDLVRQMVRVLHSDTKKAQVILTEQGIEPRDVAALERAGSDEFWATFDAAPFDALEFLENRIAPLATDGDLLFVQYAGTDIQAFQNAFDRMEIVDGTVVPPGERGFLFPKFVYEEFLKLKTARRLDKIKEARDVGGKTIATDTELQRFVKENQTQTREIVLQLDSIKTGTMTEKLQGFLGSKETDLSSLLSTFFETSDETFDARYAFWTAELAPMLDLYKVRVGDTLSIQAFGRSGYVNSVNVKVYGTFQFKGLEKSPLAGNLSLMDLASFRQLYGFLTEEGRAELKAIQAESGAQAVSREDAEAALFGGDENKTVVAEATPGVIDEATLFGDDLLDEARREELKDRVYDPEQIEKGAVLNAAVLLKDPSRLEETKREIEKVAAADGIKLKALSWQEASGMLGQLVLVFKGILFVLVFIAFIVAMAIINNAMMMATIRRTREIGTMRAIGAQRSLVLSMILVETLVLGLGFGALGALAGTGVMKWLNAVGIPAANEQLYFFFAGPRLHPTLSAGNLIVAFVIVLVVSAISTLYPAFVATRVSPVTAMQAED